MGDSRFIYGYLRGRKAINRTSLTNFTGCSRHMRYSNLEQVMSDQGFDESYRL